MGLRIEYIPQKIGESGNRGTMESVSHKSKNYRSLRLIAQTPLLGQLRPISPSSGTELVRRVSLIFSRGGGRPNLKKFRMNSPYRIFKNPEKPSSTLPPNAFSWEKRGGGWK